MLPQQNVPAALHAIHRIVVQARWMAYHDAPSKQLAAILDGAEILPTLLTNDRDETAFFQMMLESLAEQFPMCRGILSEYVQKVGSVPTDCGADSRDELLRKLAANGEKILPRGQAVETGQD